ncbi:acyl-CoA carboxylase subunit beta [Clostridium thermarum]|uniref:acyl-CoA carboxylase subunit beta n=1 Tax=Clostridium thermarum TaxID=1716543 RepID=UPI0013CF61E0|nr:carboxyl transferase domain-containing protein [Clostridium thermarum]
MIDFDELSNRRAISLEGGRSGKDSIQHSNGKMTARERIEYLIDKDSFVELGLLSKGNGGGVLTGYGTINGSLVYIYSQDITVNGGIMNKSNSEKILNIMNLALKMGAPLIHILDSVGGDINEGMSILSSYGAILNLQSKMSGVIPQISLVCGPCTGAAAISACLSDITIMTKVAELYINSSERIEKQSRTYTEGSKYATAEVGARSGSVQLIADNDKDGLDKIKSTLSYIPRNNRQLMSFEASTMDEVIKNDIDTLYCEGKATYKEILTYIADDNSVFEIDNCMGTDLYTCFIKLRGLSLGVIATDSSRAQGLNIKDCEKAVKFIKLCNAFNISILSLVDCKGFIGSAEEEAKGLSLYAAKLVYALVEANVPKVALIIGNSLGAGHMAFASKDTTFDLTFALPYATICPADPSEMVRYLHGEEIILSDNPKLKEDELLKKFIEKEASALKAAEDGHIDDVIKPSEARITLLRSFDMLQSKRELRYPRKHGSVLI